LVFAVAGIWKAVFAAQAVSGLPSRWHPRDVFGFHALPRTGATLEARQQSADASAKQNTSKPHSLRSNARMKNKKTKTKPLHQRRQPLHQHNRKHHTQQRAKNTQRVMPELGFAGQRAKEQCPGQRHRNDQNEITDREVVHACLLYVLV
jgi:hypothetical protein